MAIPAAERGSATIRCIGCGIEPAPTWLSPDDVVATAGGRYSLQCEVENVDAWVFLEAAASQTPANNGIGGVNGIGRFQPFSGLELTPLLSEMTEALHNARPANDRCPGRSPRSSAT